jgi:hypothetical protein
MHVDCDLYAGAIGALRHCVPKLAPGAIVLFDEMLVYPGFEEHEAKALFEVTEEGLQWEPLFSGGEKFAIVCGGVSKSVARRLAAQLGPVEPGAMEEYIKREQQAALGTDPPEVDPETGVDPGAPQEPV